MCLRVQKLFSFSIREKIPVFANCSLNKKNHLISYKSQRWSLDRGAETWSIESELDCWEILLMKILLMNCPKNSSIFLELFQLCKNWKYHCLSNRKLIRKLFSFQWIEQINGPNQFTLLNWISLWIWFKWQSTNSTSTVASYKKNCGELITLGVKLIHWIDCIDSKYVTKCKKKVGTWFKLNWNT